MLKVIVLPVFWQGIAVKSMCVNLKTWYTFPPNNNQSDKDTGFWNKQVDEKTS